MAPLVLAVVLVTASLTALARAYALHRRLLDQPGERRSHAVATPRGGGIGMVLGVAAVLAVWAWQDSAHRAALLLVLAGLALVAGIGWRDDHGHVPARWRLCVHLAAAVLLGLAAATAHPGAPSWHAVWAAALAVLLINAWNFMDGIDGIATLQMMAVAVVYAAIAWRVDRTGLAWPLAVVLVAAGLGFLPFNVPRARIFMGDVGSGALGYLLAAVIALADTDKTGPVVWGFALIPFGIDTALTLSRRIVRRQPWWEPHVQHAYQRLARRLGRHGPVAVGYACACLGLGAVGWVAFVLAVPALTSVGLLVAGCFIASAAWWKMAGDEGESNGDV